MHSLPVSSRLVLSRVCRPGFTLIEVLIVCVLIAVVIGIATPRVRTLTDSLAVDAAAREITSVFASARLVALRDRGAEVRLDSASIRLIAAGRVITERRVAAGHGVHIRTALGVVRYAATGIALGLSNGSIYISRGSAADTIVISRLGRVRR
jgi:prepilin-type N-terminal cleavage/methylation domain-containing protein